MLLLDIIAGARPNFMKIAPIIHAIHRLPNHESRLPYRLIHTGQHYDASMSGAFFEQLGIPNPHVNLEVGSGTQAEQTAAVMTRYEKLLAAQSATMCLVVGDVTSTMATAITARKMNVPVAHVEAGIRSGDWSMPEEVNRIVTDSISAHLFTTSRIANATLTRNGATPQSIHFVGNTMIDTLLANLHRLQAPDFFASHLLAAGRYVVLTLHRPANVDDVATFRPLLREIASAACSVPVIFPVHPRSRKSLESFGASIPQNVLVVSPQPYLEFIYLVKHSLAVVTDSGGITEEATVLGVPCMTLRDSTERPETVTEGTNELLGTDPMALAPAFRKLFGGQWKKGNVPELWDGNAGQRIVDVLTQVC
jgi:UDP-N-acetylglucosamine 2-epimerase (non-hydrolysing)